MKFIAQISCPAKAILCGQHAVVYGQDAIAFAVNLRCYAKVFEQNIKKTSQSAEIIQVILKNNNQHQKIIYFYQSFQICEQIIQTLQKQKGQKIKFDENLLDYNVFQKQFFQKVECKLLQKSQHFTTINFKISLFFLLYQIKQIKNQMKNFLIEIQSDIPIGKCLGSSASFNTVLATSLLIAFFQKLNKFNENLNECIAKQNFKQQVNLLSKLFQKVEHGNPSGIDNYVSVYGGLVLYNKSKQQKFVRITQEKILKRLTEQLIIGFQDTNIPKNTKQAVSNVREKYILHQKGNQKYKNIIEQIGKISPKVIQILSASQNWIQELFYQIQKNHQFLKQLGLSNNAIQQIVKKNNSKGKICCKITGSGMGGYVLILAIKQLHQQLKTKKDILISKISKQGLLINLKSE